MREIEDFSRIIGDIYDATLDDTRWPDALETVGRFVGGPSTALWCKDTTGDNGNATFHAGFDQGYVQAYFDDYMKHDAAGQASLFTRIGDMTAHSSVMPHTKFLQTRLYKEWVHPQGYIDCVHLTLDKSATGIALFSVSRRSQDGIVDDNVYQRLSLVMPHLRRAVLVGKTIGLKTAKAAALDDAVDGLRSGMFVVDGNARIVHANAVGHALLASDDLLRGNDGRLSFRDPQVDAYMRSIFTAASQGDAAVGTRGIAVPLVTSADERHVAHVLPLTKGLRARVGAAHRAVAAVFIHKASLDIQSVPDLVAKSYGLTPTEVRVLLEIVKVGGAPDAAAALGIAVSTVKTHLSHIYEKTGTNSHADLVRFMAALASPLI